MGPLAAMLSALVVADVGETARRYKRNAVLWLIASLFFLTAYFFALVAGTIYLSTLYTALQATIILAVASIVLALVIIGIIAASNARSQRIAEERRRRSQAKTSLAIATAMTLFRRQPLLAAGLAVGIGTVLGLMRKPGDHGES